MNLSSFSMTGFRNDPGEMESNLTDQERFGKEEFQNLCGRVRLNPKVLTKTTYGCDAMLKHLKHL